MGKIRNSFLSRFLALEPTFIFYCGVALRVYVFMLMGPFNSDGPAHFQHIGYVATHFWAPISTPCEQTYQPPLYYFLAAPFWVEGAPKIAQILSLVFSLATLVLFRRLVSHPALFVSAWAKRACFAAVAILPQFVQYGLLVSNDSLAILLGVWIISRLANFAENPKLREGGWLAVGVVLGLLTKGTFLPFPFVLAPFVGWRLWQKDKSLNQALGFSFLFLFSCITLGSFKYVQNYLHLTQVFVSNIDSSCLWVRSQLQAFPGWWEFLSANPLRLVFSPTVSQATRHSFPLMMYGTFWYPHIADSSFLSPRYFPTRYLGSLIYLVALLPTLVSVRGLLVIPQTIRAIFVRQASSEDVWRATRSCAIAVFLANVALVLIAMLKYEVWSIQQARLVFPSIAGLFFLFDAGASTLSEWRERKVLWSVRFLSLAFILYYLMEGAICFAQLSGLQYEWFFPGER